jgi:hypothetical protein
MPRRMTNTFTVPRYSPHVHRPVPRAREQQTWSDKQGGPLQVSKQRLKTEMCPVTRAPVTKSAMTRNMGKSIVEIILTDRRRKSSRENQRMGLENGTLHQPVKKSTPKTRPAQQPVTCQSKQPRESDTLPSCRVLARVFSDRVRASKQAKRPSTDHTQTHQQIGRPRSPSREPVSGRPDDLHADTRIAETRGVQAVFELNVTFAFSRFL